MEENIERIEIDRDLCIGAASCTVLAPDVYALDEENIAVLVDGWDKLQKGYDYHMEAAQSCPVDAILLFGKGDEQLYP